MTDEAPEDEAARYRDRVVSSMLATTPQPRLQLEEGKAKLLAHGS